MLRSLGERLLLHHGLVVLHFSSREKFRPVVVILHIRDFAAEKDLLASGSALHGVSQDIARPYIDTARILSIFEVLLNFDKVSLVRKGGLDGMPDC